MCVPPAHATKSCPPMTGGVQHAGRTWSGRSRRAPRGRRAAAGSENLSLSSELSDAGRGFKTPGDHDSVKSGEEHDTPDATGVFTEGPGRSGLSLDVPGHKSIDQRRVSRSLLPGTASRPADRPPRHMNTNDTNDTTSALSTTTHGRVGVRNYFFRDAARTSGEGREENTTSAVETSRQAFAVSGVVCANGRGGSHPSLLLVSMTRWVGVNPPVLVSMTRREGRPGGRPSHTATTATAHRPRRPPSPAVSRRSRQAAPSPATPSGAARKKIISVLGGGPRGR